MRQSISSVFDVEPHPCKAGRRNEAKHSVTVAAENRIWKTKLGSVNGTGILQDGIFEDVTYSR